MYLELFGHDKFSTEPEFLTSSGSPEILIKGALNRYDTINVQHSFRFPLALLAWRDRRFTAAMKGAC